MVFVINIIISYPQCTTKVDLTRLLEGRPTRWYQWTALFGWWAWWRRWWWCLFRVHFIYIFIFFTFCQLNISSFLDDGKVDGLLANNIRVMCKSIYIHPSTKTKPLAWRDSKKEAEQLCYIGGLWMQWCWSWWRRKLEGEENIIMGA